MATVQQDVLQTVLQLENLGVFGAGMGRVGAMFDYIGNRADHASRRMFAFSAGGAIAAFGLGRLVSSFVGEAGKLEQVRVGFTNVMGSAEAAKQKITELQDFAARTPFSFGGAVKMAQQLRAMGIPAEELVTTMTALGNATSALGLGEDVLARIVFNFGQIRTQGKLTTRELRDFAMNGIPVYDILQQKLGLTQEQLRRIGEHDIDARVALPALLEGLQERFAGAMEKQNKTLFGSFRNLIDVAQQVGAAFGGPLASGLSFGIEQITGFLRVIQKAPDWIKGFAGVLLGIGIVALTTYSIKLGIAAFQTAKLIPNLIQGAAEHYKNAAAATAHANALDRVSTSATKAASTVTGGSTPYVDYATRRQSDRIKEQLAGMGAGPPITMAQWAATLPPKEGLLSRIKGMPFDAMKVGMVGGALGLGGAALAQFGGPKNPVTNVLGGALGFGGAGLSIGAAFGPLGALIGGLSGLSVGALAALATQSQQKEAESETNNLLKSIDEKLGKISDNSNELLKTGGAVDSSVVPVAVQHAISELERIII